MSGGQQVRRELHPTYRTGDRAAQCFGEHGLADPWHVLDQQVTLGQQHDEREVDRAAFSLDDAFHRVPYLAHDLDHVTE